MWYDGYCFDEDHAYHVFSTISVLNFFASINARFKNYWFDLGGIPAILKHSVKNMADDFLTINIEDEDLRLWVDKSQFFNQDSFYTMHPKVLLFQTGYLTLASPIREDVVMLKLPNEEIRDSLRSLKEALFSICLKFMITISRLPRV